MLNAPVEPRTRAREPRASYVDVSWGQAHGLISGAGNGGPPLYALHGTAYSSRAFRPLMAALTDRTVVALDTPGYGSSTRPSRRWTIEQYAEALSEAIEEGGHARVDLLGYHTGAMIALAVAASRPTLVRRLVLIGVPYFPDPGEREAWRTRLAEPMRLTESLSQFDERWSYLVRGRATGASLEQGFSHFVDELRAWPFGFWAHEAAFTFDATSCVSRVLQPTLILNPSTPLAEPSRRAAAALHDAQVQELAHLGHGVLDVASGELATRIQAFLD